MPLVVPAGHKAWTACKGRGGWIGLGDLQNPLAASVSMVESLGITGLLVQVSLQNWADIAGGTVC